MMRAVHHETGKAIRAFEADVDDQDAAFGMRQLTDIAVKSPSPAINDPVTATHALGHLSDLAVTLVGRRLGPRLRADADGVGRVVIPGRDLQYHLDLVCGPVRRYGRAEPTVLIALLRLLRDLATAVDGSVRAAYRDRSGETRSI